MHKYLKEEKFIYIYIYIYSQKLKPKKVKCNIEMFF